MNGKTISAHGRVEVLDGDPIMLPEETIQRVVYALTTLGLTPIIDHVAIQAVYDVTGEKLWPPK